MPWSPPLPPTQGPSGSSTASTADEASVVAEFAGRLTYDRSHALAGERVYVHNSVWGCGGRGTWCSVLGKVLSGSSFALRTDDPKLPTDERVYLLEWDVLSVYMTKALRAHFNDKAERIAPPTPRPVTPARSRGGSSATPRRGRSAGLLDT